MSCFETIIGLVPDADVCPDGYIAAYSTSKSGLYLSELSGISINDACGLQIFNLMLQARRTAINTVKTDLMQESSKFITPSRHQFTGDIGGVNFNRLETTDGAYGMRIFSSLAGARIRYTGITFMPPSDGDFLLTIYDDFDELGTENITGCTERKPKKIVFDTPYIVTQGSTYFIVSGGTAYSGKMFCCGKQKGWCFDINKPCYNTSNRGWTSWVMAAGIHGTDWQDREDWRTYSRNYGMSVHASFSCNLDDILCSDFSDFEVNDKDRALAFAILYKTGEYFLNAVIDTGEVSRYTLLASEAIDFRREEYLGKYQQMVTWLSQNISISGNDCFSCKPIGRITNRLGVK